MHARVCIRRKGLATFILMEWKRALPFTVHSYSIVCEGTDRFINLVHIAMKYLLKRHCSALKLSISEGSAGAGMHFVFHSATGGTCYAGGLAFTIICSVCFPFRHKNSSAWTYPSGLCDSEQSHEKIKIDSPPFPIQYCVLENYSQHWKQIFTCI